MISYQAEKQAFFITQFDNSPKIYQDQFGV